MKRTLLALASVLMISGASAQIQMDNPPATVYGGYTQTSLDLHFNVINGNGSTMDIQMRRNVTSEVSGTYNSFCWGVNCYPPSVDVSSSAVSLGSGASESSFVAYYNPDGNPGITTVEYCWYEDGNQASTEVCTSVDYDASFANGIDNKDFVNEVSVAYPNPADNSTSLNYHVRGNRAELVVNDMLGARVLSERLTGQNGVAILNTSNLKNGVYFYSLFVDGEVVATRKLVVAHK